MSQVSYCNKFLCISCKKSFILRDEPSICLHCGKISIVPVHYLDWDAEDYLIACDLELSHWNYTNLVGLARELHGMTASPDNGKELAKKIAEAITTRIYK